MIDFNKVFKKTGSTTYSSILQIVDDEPKENVGDHIVKN